MMAPATWPAKRVTFSAHPVIFGGETTTGPLPQSPSLPCVIRWTTSLEMNCRQDKPLIHSNSTSHLHYRDQRRQQPLEDARKRFSSSEGRFSIIDEQSKDTSGTSESDEDTPLPNGFKAPQRVATTPAFSQSLPHGHPHMATAASVSRFRIVPVESRYKRGRWECFDYYQKELPRNSKASCPGPPRTLSNLNHADRTVRSWTTELSPAPATAPAASKGSTFQFDNPVNKNSSPKHKVLKVDVVQDRMTPTEMLQTGLESTLNTAEIKKKENIPGSTATSHNGNSPSTVAIDSKIEQAMDLVKSHLMFAVREEVEGLRQKIGELETHIHHLESENAILRGHVPADVLGGLHAPK